MPTQAERSQATCERLLDATFRCLVERGYAATSLPEICRRAGASRGAQLHHYGTKEQLVSAAVAHVLELRLAEFESLLGRTLSPTLDLQRVAAAMWATYTSEAYYAWLELVVAARTSPALRRILLRVDEQFVERAERLCHAAILPHVHDRAEVQAMTRLILAIFDGLATHRILSEDDELPRRALRVAANAGLFWPKGAQA
jgi:AcrR family transcriptional regulator